MTGARGLAWDEYTRNTLANHAALWPDHWDGTISLDDVCFGFYSAHPNQCGNGLGTTYEGQITEQPTWMVMNAIRLAGITPTSSGYDIDPHLPFGQFSLRLPDIGIASEADRLRGYVRPEGGGPNELGVHLPSGVSPARVTSWANGNRVPHTAAGTVVTFTLPATAGAPADWALTWSASAAGAAPGGALCASRRRFVIRLRGPHDERLRSARVYVDGRRVRTLRRMRAVIDLRRRPRSAVTVRIVGRTRSGRRVIAVRRYHLCVARRRHRGQGQGQGQGQSG